MSEKTDGLLATKVQDVSPQIDTAYLHRHWAAMRKLTTLQVLSVLRNAIEDEQVHLQFNYVSMHSRCMTRLNNLRDAFIPSATDQLKDMMRRSAKIYGESIPLQI